MISNKEGFFLVTSPWMLGCCDPTPTNAPVVDEAVLGVLG
jgi:hypothetical protein